MFRAEDYLSLAVLLFHSYSWTYESEVSYDGVLTVTVSALNGRFVLSSCANCYLSYEADVMEAL